MGKIRTLIVDDAVVIRRLLTDLLSADPALEVVGTAPNGRIALAKIPQVNPDLVILDVEMPEMNGLETLTTLRQTYPHLPVIMFSQFTLRGAAVTLDALALGANDYVAKPENAGSADEAVQNIRDQLIPKIKLHASRAPRCRTLPLPRTQISPHRRLFAEPGVGIRPKVEIVAIGASTGGPNALTSVLGAVPESCPVPIVIVQHMPPVFTRLLAERLSSQCAIRVGEATSGEILDLGKAWLAPGDHHLTLERQGEAVRLKLGQGPPENSCRPSVDVLFRSVAEVYGPNTLAVLLTGMGQDGLRGCERIREAGGQVLVQDAATSVVWGMPGSVAKAGLADQVLPLHQLGPEMIRRVRQGRAKTFHG